MKELSLAYNDSMNHSLRSHPKLHRQSRFSFLCQVLFLGGLVFTMKPDFGFGDEKKPSNEEGRFGIYLDGREIGEEKYSIQATADSLLSEAVVAFKNPGRGGQDVRIEAQLTMDARYMPKTYKVRSAIDGKSRTIEATFVPNQATFKYVVNGTPRQSGLLLDDYYAVLDANVFHHFVFVARLVEFGDENSLQTLDVVIPQEMDNGVLKIQDAGIEKISIQGKNRELHHLKADSGALKIDLWVDKQRILHKIAIPMKNIEVIRKS